MGTFRICPEIVITFEPLWANPVWSVMQWHVESEREQILRLLRLTLVDLPRPVTPTPVQVLKAPTAERHSTNFSFQGGGTFLAILGQIFLSLCVTFSIASCVLVKTLSLRASLQSLGGLEDDWEKVSETPLDESPQQSGSVRTAEGGG